MRISWRDVFVICTSYWTFDISGSLIQALSQWGRLKKLSGPAMSVDLFSPRPRPAFSIAPVTLAHLRSVYEQAGINDLRQRTTDSPHWLGSWNRLHQWIILGWGCVQPWDEAFVFAFKFCLPHYSVTPFLIVVQPLLRKILDMLLPQVRDWRRNLIECNTLSPMSSYSAWNHVQI